MNPCNHEHIIIIVLKDKIQLYEVKEGRPQLFLIDKEEYLQAPTLREAVEKIKSVLARHYKKDGWSHFKITVIYEKYNIETMRLFAVEFKECARLDFISAETLIEMNAGKIKPAETGVIKFGESLFKLEKAAGDNKGEGGRMLLPIDAFDGAAGEITTKDIVLFAAPGGGPAVVDDKRFKEMERELKKRGEELKSEREQAKELHNKITALEKQVEIFEQKIKESEKEVNECSSLRLYKELCGQEAEFNRIKEYIELVVSGGIDKNKISFSDFKRGKRPLKTIKDGSHKDIIELKLEKNVDLKLKLIPPGEFWIGGKPEFQDYSKGGASAKKPPLKIIITKPFYMGIYPVTQAQWLSIMKSNPSNFQKGGDYPVEMVSWQDCKKFIETLNGMDLHDISDWDFRLPTEAEWEYACRAGSETEYYWGDKFDDKYCWHKGNSNSSTQPVGKKKPNEFGLYDMSGNVWEWCEDLYDGGFYDSDFALNGKGFLSEQYRYVEDPFCDEGSDRVFRGGGWGGDSDGCRSAYRDDFDPSDRDRDLGFRLALSPGQK